jgi:Fibronectin type III domain
MPFTKALAGRPGPGRRGTAAPGRRGPRWSVLARVCLAAALLAGTLAFTSSPSESATQGMPVGVAATPPGPPTGLTAVAAGTTQVALSWTAPVATGGSPLTLYRIYEGTSSPPTSQIQVVKASVTTATVTGPASGTVYYFAVSAENSTGLVSMSSNVVPFPESQTITFGSIPSMLTVGAQSIVSATASSTLQVSFQSGTPAVCRVPPSTGTGEVTAVAAGTCTITASQAGNYSWQPTTLSQSFQVIAAGRAQTISFPNPGGHQVGVRFALSASASSRLPVSFTSDTPSVCRVPPSTGTGEVTAVAAGTCTITASQAGGSGWLAATPVSQSFQVKSGVPTWLVILLPVVVILAAAGAILVMRHRRLRLRPPDGQSVQAEPHPGPPGVVTVHTTGTDATHTVHIEPHPDAWVTAVKEDLS